jgi:hypothetical protein
MRESENDAPKYHTVSLPVVPVLPVRESWLFASISGSMPWFCLIAIFG